MSGQRKFEKRNTNHKKKGNKKRESAPLQAIPVSRINYMSIIPQKNETKPKLDKYAEHQLIKEESGIARKYADIQKQWRCAECGKYLEFAKEQHPELENKTRFRITKRNACKTRYCPICQWLKRNKYLATYLPMVLELHKKYPKMRPLLLTLTVKNCKLQNLKETLKSINTALKLLFQRKKFKNITLGYIASREIFGDETPTGQAHPHIHVILFVKPDYFTRDYIKQEEWQLEWQTALKVDYAPIVDIRTIKPKTIETLDYQADGVGEKLGDFFTNSIIGGILETLKYQNKVTSVVKLNDEQFRILEYEIKGTRQVSLGGELLQMKPQELSKIEWILLETLSYKWLENSYQKFKNQETSENAQSTEIVAT